ncbi:hypothetical protein B0H16DRAFT_1696520 [Mycena metata]|uniref:Uncharacterized protein n=1 Tax=Mycena metata TaxID=1033252 RepID=A0AAD7MU16_9AGAR|nr:hypothetical protein B0H16DRAFT_1696520 [Mycena metata]
MAVHSKSFYKYLHINVSDVARPAQPECPGLGSAWAGSGFKFSRPEPEPWVPNVPATKLGGFSAIPNTEHRCNSSGDDQPNESERQVCAIKFGEASQAEILFYVLPCSSAANGFLIPIKHRECVPYEHSLPFKSGAQAPTTPKHFGPSLQDKASASLRQANLQRVYTQMKRNEWGPGFRRAEGNVPNARHLLEERLIMSSAGRDLLY